MRSSRNLNLSWDQIPTLEEVKAEIRQREAKKNADKIRATQARRGGLIEFVRYFWPVLEPQTPLVDGWPLEAICSHLEAITFGDFEKNRLLINVPPGFMKSLLANVFWPAWEWGPMDMPHLRYVTFSYSSTLTERDNGRFRDVLVSPEYKLLWGDRFALRKVGETLVSNDKTGWKLATSVRGVGTGQRGNRVLFDDPHNVKEAESDQVRGETVRWFEEGLENRLNDLKSDAIVVIMQRVHEMDVSGAILDRGDYVHLCIPMEYEVGRGCETEIGWEDPRTYEGQLAWPERFAETEILPFKRRAYMWAGQYQQRPEPRGGGIFKREWWQTWTDEVGESYGISKRKFPPLSYVIGVLDTAYTEKEENDPCAMTVLGIWHDREGAPQVMLMTAWEEWLEFNALVEKTANTCQRFRVDRLLIESKASGISVAQEIKRRYAHENWGVQLVDPGRGDKVSRAYAVTHAFEDGLVWAPGVEEDQFAPFAARVVDQMATFPKSFHDDLTDTVTMGLKYLREQGLLVRREEFERDERDLSMHRPDPRPLYG